MIHVLLTPPDTETTLGTLGVFQLGCDTMPMIAHDIFCAMASEGWLVQAIIPALFSMDDDKPARRRGQSYIGAWLLNHPEMDPLA